MSGHAQILASLLVTTLAATATGCSEQPQPTKVDESPAAPSPMLAATPAQTSSPAIAQPNSQESTMRAYIDPVTGKLREPTQEEMAALAAAEAAKQAQSGAQSKTAEPREVRLPNGAVMVELGESAQQPLIACVQKNGEVKMEHTCEGTPGSKAK